MDTRSLGRTGIQVSQLCFGTMAFGGDADESTSADLYTRCRDAGINFFDCANVYAGGRSEEILGVLEKGEQASALTRLADDLPLFSAEVKQAEPAAAAKASAVEARLGGINPDELTPKEALELLYELRRLAEEG